MVEFCDFCLLHETNSKHQKCPLCDIHFKSIKLCDDCMDIHLQIHEKNPIEEKKIDIDFDGKCGDSSLF